MKPDRTSAPPGLYKRIFERQILHVVLLAVLLVAVGSTALRHDIAAEGGLWGIPARSWFWIAVSSAVAHQAYVWLAWRLELYAGAVTRVFPRAGFRIFTAGFTILGLSRLLIIPLAVADRGTVQLHGALQWGLSALFLLLSAYLLYSVLRYFGIKRALGADHFDPDARNWPLVNEGIFRYTSNGMYVVGFLLLWIPGLVLESAAALLAAAFHHVYIWVHYLCTEKPDMEAIYGDQSAD